MKFRIEEFVNRDLITIHLSKKISEESHITFYSPAWTNEKYSGQKPEELRYLAGSLFQIDGVTEVTIHPYEISIQKGMCFTWDELVPQLIRAINVMVADKEEMEELPKIAMSDEEALALKRKYEREMNKWDYGDDGFFH